MNYKEVILNTDSKLKAEKKFWDNKLKGIDAKCTLRYNWSVNGEMAGKNWDYSEWSLGNDTYRKLFLKLCNGSEPHMYMLLLSALQLAVSKYNQTEEVIVQSPALGNGSALLYIRTGIGPAMTLKAFLMHVQELVSEANKHPHFLSFDLNDNKNSRYRSVSGIHFSPGETDVQADLCCSYRYTETDLQVTIKYDTALYDRAAIERFGNYFLQLLEHYTYDLQATIASLEVLTSVEKERIRVTFNNTTRIWPPQQTVISLFEAQVLSTPENTAVAYQGNSLTYTALNEKANALATYLAERGVTRGSLVGVLLEPSDALLVAVLGVLKTGAAYVPVDTAYPMQRKQYIVENSSFSVLVSTDDLIGSHLDILQHISLSDLIDVTSISVPATPATFTPVSNMAEDLAYVLYTSGSTGRPKGVMIAHGALMNYLNWANETYINGEPCNMALFTSIAFDLTVTSVFLPLISGNTVYVYDQSGDGLPVQRVIADGHATVIKLTPSHLKVLCETPGTLPGIKRIIVGGEQFESELALQLLEKTGGQTEIYNEYGPTEATVGCVLYKYVYQHDSGTISKNVLIGKPVANTRIYILDRDGNIAPCHTPGELYIGGAQLFMGYINSPEQTAQRLLPDPFVPGEKVYRTGDLACWQDDGNLMFLGRIDEQVKIRGYRIEPGEIEIQLAAHPLVRSAVAGVKERAGDPYLVAYYVAEKPVPAQELKSYLSQSLPEYMVPLYYVRIDHIPLTANGKTDRRALPDPELQADGNFVAPAGETEERLVRTWSEVLGLKEEQISVTASFFELGGDSIKSIQLAAKIYKLGYIISVQDIFSYATIRKLAPVLKEIQGETVQAAVVGETVPGPVQQWFFAKQLAEKHHYNQSVMLHFPEGLSLQAAQAIFHFLMAHHDALRMVFRFENGNMIQWQQDVGITADIREIDFRNENTDSTRWLNECNAIQAGIDLEQGPLVKAGLFQMTDGSRLLIVIHHLVVDGVSWRILLEDIETLYRLYQQGAPLGLPSKTHAFQLWTSRLAAYRQQPSFLKAAAYWAAGNDRIPAPLVPDFEDGVNTTGMSRSVTVTFSQEETIALLREVHQAYGTQLQDLLLSALVMAYNRIYGHSSLLLDMEGHGREGVIEGLDLSRTVGWFTSIYPVWLECTSDMAFTIKQVKETLRRIPNKGFDYLLCKYQGDYMAPVEAQISFNYLGQFDTDINNRSYVMDNAPQGNTQSGHNEREYDWDIISIITGGVLRTNLVYSTARYQHATVQQFLSVYKEVLTDIITHCRQQALAGRVLTPSDLTYRELSVTALDQLQKKYDISDIYPLSPMQEGMLFHSLLAPSSQQYFEQVAYRLQGQPDETAMVESLQYLMDRYDILRTVFTSEERTRNLQIVLKHRSAAFTSRDIRHEITKENKEEVLENYRQQDRRQTFDLRSDVLIRVLLLRTGEQEYELIWSFHHILMDGWCLGILVKEFNEYYNGKLMNTFPQLPAAVPYVNFIKWLEAKDPAPARAYWKNYLENYDTLTGIPRRNNTVSVDTLHADQEVVFTLTSAQTAALQGLAGSNGVTLNTVIQVIWALLLSKYNNTRDVLFGAVVSGRPAEIAGIESMVGLFINTIPVRISISESETFTSLFKKVQMDSIAGMPYHYSPLAEIQGVSALGRSLLDHILVFENYLVTQAPEGSTAASLKSSQHSVYEQTSYGLTISIIPGETLTFKFQYDPEIYAPWMISQVGRHFRSALENVIEPEMLYTADLEMLSSAEQQMLITDFNATSLNYPQDTTVIGLFEEQVRRNPGQVAVCFGNSEITYGALEQRATAIAGYLQENGISRGAVVGILMSRSIELIAAILGVMKSGAAYLPVETDSPRERTRYLLQNSGASCVLTDNEAVTTELTGVHTVSIRDIGQAAADVTVRLTAEDLCYVIYTSGSTGQPKGVMISHGALLNYLSWANDTYIGGEQAGMALFTSIAFDLAVTSVFLPLISGNTLYVYGQEAAGLPVHKVVADGRTAVLKLTPSHLKVLCESPEPLHGVRRIIVGGEQFEDHLARKAYEKAGKAIEIYNEYGPTEATVGCVLYQYDSNRSGEYKNVLIGKPVANTRIYILDRSGKVMPCGVPGELFIAGAQLFRGYMAASEETAKRLIPDPFQTSPAQMYRSGDLACWLPDGNIMFLGRIDNQVKLRGYRIEPGEIETQLLGHSAIKSAVVTVREKAGQSALVAYYTNETPVTGTELKSYLLEKLPVYMVPALYVPLESIPLTANGKVDYRALPEPEAPVAGQYLQPANKTEERLLQLWSEVLSLKKEAISIEANFFELGGNSILITRLTTGLREMFNIPVTVADVFRLTNIREMALFINGKDKLLQDEEARLQEARKGKNTRLNIMKALKKA